MPHQHSEAAVCMLAGHQLEPGQEIAQCAVCDQKGCPDCLDSHDCKDFDKEMFLQ